MMGLQDIERKAAGRIEVHVLAAKGRRRGKFARPLEMRIRSLHSGHFGRQNNLIPKCCVLGARSTLLPLQSLPSPNHLASSSQLHVLQTNRVHHRDTHFGSYETSCNFEDDISDV